MKSNISDKAIVLSRVNYGETDRILTILCSQHGKLSVIAKGARAGKSKLAGGIELFAENDLVLLKSKSDLYIVTSSRMKNYFGNIAKHMDASTYAYECLKTINKLVPEGSGEEYYEPLLNLLSALDKNEIPLTQLRIWFGLKALNNLGASPNLTRSSNGKELPQNAEFEFDFDDHCFFQKAGGTYSPDHIKILRYLSKAGRPVEIKLTDTVAADKAERLVTLLLEQHIR